MTGTLWTLGHSDRSPEEVLAILRENGVQAVADVRSWPASRRFPWFGASEMARWLAREGVEYRHLPGLGGLGRQTGGEGTLGEPFRGNHRDVDVDRRFRGSLAALFRMARRRPTVMLCAEADPARCHRNSLADRASSVGWTVVDLLGPGRAVGRLPLRRPPGLEGCGAGLGRGLGPESGAIGDRTGEVHVAMPDPFGENTGRPKIPCGGNMSSIHEKVRNIIVEQLGVDAAEVKDDAHFVDDLGADSLDTVELVMALEEEFGIEIPDEDAEKITRVKDAVEYIETHEKKA